MLERQILHDVDLAGRRINGDRERRNVVGIVQVKVIEMTGLAVFSEIVVGIDTADNHVIPIDRLLVEIDLVAFGRVKARPNAVGRKL